MKSTDIFKRTILSYLEQQATSDPMFAEAFSNPDKDIDSCIAYILNTVQKSGCNGFGDMEIYSMALHYYLEADVEIGKPVSCQISVNHVVELTEEEKAEARKEAIQRVQDEAYNRMMQPRKKAKQVALNPQPSLFDF